ncbi:MAG: helix-turn-helix domain-containing protein [Bdellovibrionales bacterium]
MDQKETPNTDAKHQDLTQGVPPYVNEAVQQERLGAILKRIRERRDEDIEDIAGYLCIRVSYLRALENSEYEKLPADAYVIGFLKSYASYLDLDEKGAVNQYRYEMAGRRRKPQLSMPQPMSEGRAPTLAIFIAGLCAVLLVYGIWYWLWAPDRSVLTEDPVLQEETLGETEKEEVPPASLLLETTSMPEVAPMGTIVIEAKESEAVETVPLQKKAEVETVVETQAKVEIKKAEKAEKETTTEKLEENLDVDSTEPLGPRIFGTKRTSHITLTAESESWILVTDSKGLTVFDRTLNTGESYRVPNRKGLRLTTGNAEGLAISIDSKKMPKLHPIGKVARGVPLDPDKFKDILTGDE